MMLKSIYIDHYRCLRDFTVDFADRNAVLLLGRNGAGKSTVLRVLALLQRLAFGEVRLGGLFSWEDFAFGDTRHPITIRITFSQAGVLSAYEIVVECRDDLLCVVSERAKRGDGIIFDRAPLEKNGTETFSPDVLMLPLVVGRSPDEPLARIRDLIRGLVIVSPQPSAMRSSAGQDGRFLSLDARNCLDWFAEIQNKGLGTIPKIITALQQVFSDELKTFSWGPPEGARRLTLVFKREGEEGLPLEFDSLSDGEKCFVLAAFLMVKVSEERDVVCFWDEPDNYLAISEISRFMTTLKKAFRRSGGLLVVTSHNIEGIQSFGMDETLVVSRNRHGDSATIAELSHVEPDGRNFIRKLLTGDLYDEQR